MADLYTPTTEEAREVYRLGWPYATHRYTTSSSSAEFDRWLAEVKAEAWDEGFNAGFDSELVRAAIREPSGPDLRVNPHRATSLSAVPKEEQ